MTVAPGAFMNDPVVGDRIGHMEARGFPYFTKFGLELCKQFALDTISLSEIGLKPTEMEFVEGETVANGAAAGMPALATPSTLAGLGLGKKAALNTYHLLGPAGSHPHKPLPHWLRCFNQRAEHKPINTNNPKISSVALTRAPRNSSTSQVVPPPARGSSPTRSRSYRTSTTQSDTIFSRIEPSKAEAAAAALFVPLVESLPRRT
ncbi:hypothetical protein SODALDRAFT_378205 [Sodiomyces alkalinus F11]|uniref:Uncharacterized protein n=1 Tax=Sodiomyces alkalinus (strain CBS 110278 / VKM F-3762 / F11) TaxID=1314773 RepID=A0A3N2PX74_SODAK|nr:hypothetical protein SODALDRAFT_378205 [Sodiomyces alkalinus F11]ROT39082.1 hypothetical protein SODALDRAFT_378205 [Sodiomyces alkalinus F11]